ncbi:arylesterase [Pollutimonas harenae]|uniref:Arylesterase n=1 Tax=Pollutimonas harenae TaxID=657015 RepID=A0A853GVF3_9BURK|nr:arylesterase [Pollutimonas harenae]NYT86117.1 arylesterase [Pollutimonas harenae]TEA71546.1 arylesterase [Pollutimonas harenae]
MWIRRSFAIVALCCFQFAASLAWANSQHTSPQPAVLVLGDSLSAEYGLPRGSGWVSVIDQRLDEQNIPYQIHNSSISGDTSSGGLSRLPAALEQYKPSIVIIELGANDALRGLPLSMTEKNLSKMIELSKQAHARVLLLGMQIPPNYGRKYTEQFQSLYQQLAERHGIQLTPFLLDGIAADRSRFQADGIHPNEASQVVLADNVWGQLAPMLQEHGK